MEERIALKMEAIRSSETLVTTNKDEDYVASQPEDNKRRIYRREKTTSHRALSRSVLPVKHEGIDDVVNEANIKFCPNHLKFSRPFPATLHTNCNYSYITAGV